MLTPVAAPQNLTEAIRYFADPDRAFTFMVQMRWPDGVYCPRCACTEATLIRTRRLWKCKGCKKQFSVKVGTIFEDSPLGLDKWLPALYLIANCKNGISSYELHRSLGVTQKTAWFMLHRIRAAMAAKSFKREGFTPLKGGVELDETFVGGRVSNMHKAKRDRIMGTAKHGHPAGSKVIVMGLLQRTTKEQPSQVQGHVVPNVTRQKLEHIAVNSIEPGSNVYTDSLHGYRQLHKAFRHSVVDHTRNEYVRGDSHTNGIENFWSLFKRTIKGTYIAIDPFHVHAYLGEQAFRFNARKGSDGDRFMAVLRGIVGKRLTYEGLTGADLAPATT